MTCIYAIGALLIAMPLLRGDPSPQFVVASLKPMMSDPLEHFPLNDPDTERQFRFRGGPGSRTPDSIRYRGVTLCMLLERAFSVNRGAIVGPKWFEVDRFELMATLPPKSSSTQLALMLQDLLKDRFELRFHWEKRSLRVYALTTAKNGSKLSAAKPSAPVSDEQDLRKALAKASKGLSNRPGAQNGMSLPSTTMPQFCDWLSFQLGRLVVDNSGLAGAYDINLEWSTVAAGDLSTPSGSGPTLEEALERQLGLRVRSVIAPVDVLVVDQARRMPLAN